MKDWQHRKSAADRAKCQPGLRQILNGSLMPNIFIQTVRGNAAGESEFTRKQLANSLAKYCAAHGIQQNPREKAIKSLARIQGRYKIEILPVNRLQRDFPPSQR